MATETHSDTDVDRLSCLESGVEDLTDSAVQLLTPSPSSHSSGSLSPEPTEVLDNASAAKKKKKKKAKKKAKETKPRPEPAPLPALCISRNKHWRYISSYHVRAEASLVLYNAC